MAAEYDFRENPNPHKDGKKQPLHPRIVIKGTIKTERLVKDISWGSSLTEGDIVGALRLLEERLSHYISEGYNVELGNIGYFKASLACRSVMDKKEIRAASVSFDGINFQPKAKFCKSLKGELRRAKYGFGHSSALTMEEKKSIITKHLEGNPFITRKIYSELSGRLKTLATEDINELVKDGYLIPHGRSNNRVYTKAIINKNSETE